MGKVQYLLVLSFLLLSFLVVAHNTVAAATVMRVEPAAVEDIAVGQSFTIDLVVVDVPALYAWQITLLYNPVVLNCTEAVYPTAGGIFAGLSVIGVSPIIDNTEGLVMHGATLITGTASGSGIMCHVTFEVIANGTSGLDFSSPYGADTFLLDGDLNNIPASTENGFFSNSVAPPPETHDVAITDISFSNNNPSQGDPVVVTVVAMNNGTVAENTFDVVVSNGTTVIGTQTVTNLAVGGNETLTFNWDTTGAPLGQNTITANATSVPSEIELDNNVKIASVNLQPIRHDIAITALSFSNNSPIQGDTIVITVEVKNNGTATEDSLDVMVFNGTTLIGTQTVTSLAAGGIESLTYNWNTADTPLGANSITANVTAVPAETDLSNNVRTGTVTVLSSAAKSADINSDSRYDMKDIALVCWSFYTQPGDARWNENADLTGPQGTADGKIDEFDIAAVVKHFWNKP